MNDRIKECVFRKLYQMSKKRDEYMATVPGDLYSSVIDNGYVESIIHERDMLLRLVFGDHADAIEWFLYEWKPGLEVGYEGVPMTPINDIDEYIEFMKKNEGFGYE